ncbi:MAG: hypothetical protein RL325_242 [Planctomycetota bacterium]|jgi:hypothetical protein
MAREHMPIQIGLPAEAAWEMQEPAPVSYLAFVTGDAMPDPGDAFTAIGETFGAAPQGVEPVPVEDDRVAWAFGCSLPSRAARLMVWCEHALEGVSPDGRASDARWVLFVETLLERDRAVADSVALAAAVARAGGARTKLVFDPGLGVAWGSAEIASLFLAKDGPVDERHLYRVELTARDRKDGPFWIATVGLARLGKPELELLDVPANRLRVGLELVDALAARSVEEELPPAGVPFDAGEGLRVALVPAHEAIEALAPSAPGGAADRRSLPPGPRAAICAAGKRGAFRQVWMPPLEALDLLASGQAGLFIAPRVSAVRARLARETLGVFRRLHERRHLGAAEFLAKVARAGAADAREHCWIAVDALGPEGGSGVSMQAGEATRRVEFAVADLSDWRVLGMSPELPEIGPENAGAVA